MQKQYVVKKRIMMSTPRPGFQLEVGDMLVYDASNDNKVTVYRNGELKNTSVAPPLRIPSLVTENFIELIDSETLQPIADPDPVKLGFIDTIKVKAGGVALELDSVAQNIGDAVEKDVAVFFSFIEGGSGDLKGIADAVASKADSDALLAKAKAIDTLDAVEADAHADVSKVEGESTGAVGTVEAIAKEAKSAVSDTVADAEAAIIAVKTDAVEVETTVDSATVDLTQLTKTQLLAHAVEFFGVKLNVALSKPNLILEIEKLIAAKAEAGVAKVEAAV